MEPTYNTTSSSHDKCLLVPNYSVLLDRHTPPEDQFWAVTDSRRHGEGPIAPQKKKQSTGKPEVREKRNWKDIFTGNGIDLN